MKDNHPNISLLDVGDDVKEGVSDYRYPGKIIQKRYDADKDEWTYLFKDKAGSLKPMTLTQHYLTINSDETQAAVRDRAKQIKARPSAAMESLVRSEVKLMLKEYFHTTNDNRQTEVQEYLNHHVDRDDLREFFKNPRAGRQYIRENHSEKFYWWANEDVENLFRNWR